MYFDPNEEFMKTIEQVWRKDRKKPSVPWARQVAAITRVSEKNLIPMQAGDLVAWEDNLTCRENLEVKKLAAMLRGKHVAYYDLARIEDEYTLERERGRIEGQERAGWKNKEVDRLRRSDD